MIKRMGGAAVLLAASVVFGACAGSSASMPGATANLPAPSEAAAQPTGQPSPPATPPTSDGPRSSPLALPAGMPVYPGASQAAPADEGWVIAAWTASADPPAVYDFYLAALPDAGFELDGIYPGGDVAILRFSAPDGLAYQLDLTGHDPVLIRVGAPHD